MEFARALPGVPVSSGANALTVTVTDATGNMGTQTVNFTAQPAQTTTFSYDLNGNLASVQSVESVDYFYDAENRLVRAVSNNVTVLECWYDGAGHRIAKREIVGGQTNTVQYIWDGWNLIAVLGGDGKLKEFYTRGVGIAGDIGTLVAVRHWTNALTGPLYYLHNNHRGDVILARQGTVTVATLDYAPYGELRTQSGTYTPRFRFSSKEYDAATGFYHFGFRAYAPTWARWLSRDPIFEGTTVSLLDLRGPARFTGRGGGGNAYLYDANNPLRFFDPLGLTYFPIPPGPIFPFPISLFPPCSGPASGEAAPQDFKCSFPGGDKLNQCFQKCCAEHDQCYIDNGCNAWSWLIECGSASCKLCNATVVACFAKASFDTASGNCCK